MTVPTDIANLVRWYKADALVLSDTDPVASWTDSSTTNDPAVQGTADAKPTYRTSILNGLPVVRFDGGDSLAFTSLALSNFTVMAVLNATGDGMILGGVTPQIRIGQSANVLSTWDGAVNPQSNAMSPAQTVFSIVELVRTTNTVAWFQNGFSLGTGTMTAPNSFTSIGTGAGVVLTGDIAELVIYDAAVSAGDRVLLESYFSSKYWKVTPRFAHLARLRRSR